MSHLDNVIFFFFFLLLQMGSRLVFIVKSDFQKFFYFEVIFFLTLNFFKTIFKNY